MYQKLKNDNAVLYQSEGIRLLYMNAIPGILITFLASTTLVFTFLQKNFVQDRVLWWGFMTLLLTVRLVDTLLWFRANAIERQDKKWGIRFSAGCLLTAVVWSSYPVLFYQQFGFEEFSTTLVIISAMAGGATGILSGSLSLSSLYNIIMLVPTSFLLILQPESFKINMGYLGFAFAFIMLVASYRTAKYVREAIQLRYENKSLVLSMEATIKERTQALFELSNKDALTGLFNRSAFLSAAEKVLTTCYEKRDEGISIFFIDLDEFKYINDTQGHSVGDHILSTISHRLHNLLASRGILCRWGGDEFILLCYETTRQKVEALVKEILVQVALPIDFAGHSSVVHATVGISLYPEHGNTLTALIQSADIAMYYQKNSYPGGYTFYSSLIDSQYRRRNYLNDALKTALEEGEFRLVYQPIVDCLGHTVSVEALLRWRHQNENISPVEFIVLLEQNGGILPVGEWIIDEACKTLSELNMLGSHINISVNVSVIQLEDKDFVANVIRLLEKHNVPGHLLHFEVTESIFHSEHNNINDRVMELKRHGIKISVDDFGTGYSSLSVIQNMEIDYIKIDRAFIENIDRKGLAIVQAIMELSRELNFSVIAEGVETEDQKNTLLQCGVSFMQGFYFSKPLEREALLSFLR